MSKYIDSVENKDFKSEGVIPIDLVVEKIKKLNDSIYCPLEEYCLQKYVRSWQDEL